MSNKIEKILQPYQKFGISLELDRIKKLLDLLGNPQQQVPIIHVAGTNGKGSVCAYLSAILTQAGYQTGRYTSPHLINWTERICLNEKPIAENQLEKILLQINQVISNNYQGEIPTQFEIITAAAWLYFAQSQVDLAIMEVGLGGRLDATNVSDRPLVSIITSISREHWQRLGDTLGKIAYEKAGVIKSECPVVIGQLPPEAQQVVQDKIRELNCPYIWVKPATKTTVNGQIWGRYEDIQYPLAIAGDIQLHNSALAIATVKILQQRGWKIPHSAIEEGMRQAYWPGRIEWKHWRGHKLLIDGAHNVAAAKVLRAYIETLDQEIIWVMGMLSTKDHQGILSELLRPQDQLHLVPVPDHSTITPQDLAPIAREICPHLSLLATYPDLFIALDQVTTNIIPQRQTIVICGSLYLLGYFLANENSQ
jgi:dihydrofolate synthase/folylpolyglutamate synthase